MAMGCGRAVRECACRVRGECVLLDDSGYRRLYRCSARGAAHGLSVVWLDCAPSCFVSAANVCRFTPARSTEHAELRLNSAFLLALLHGAHGQ